jgi:hypothetical protein
MGVDRECHVAACALRNGLPGNYVGTAGRGQVSCPQRTQVRQVALFVKNQPSEQQTTEQMKHAIDSARGPHAEI